MSMAQIGLERGQVRLVPHNSVWAEEARRTIEILRPIFGSAAFDIQHVGSTSIPGIQAKPIIDIAVAAVSFEAVEALVPALEEAGFVYRRREEWQMFFAQADYSRPDGLQTHFLHVVLTGSTRWRDYINFRDYLRAKPEEAKAYEALKMRLAEENPVDPGREKYLAGKHDFIVRTLREALAWSWLGREAAVTVDRPLGSAHPGYPDLIYPLNYGYIEGETAPDGEDLDVYILVVEQPLREFTGRIIAVIHRLDDAEDKLVASAAGFSCSAEEIAAAVDFQERYYKTVIEMAGGMTDERYSSGARDPED